ncbi:MAG TPA: hypothetical protein VGP46_02315 [Acidimicrobiales bacterium]|jgi:hypothetical protein|nr:hypothetical protein [Acidimicrobiales bacterium]
MTDSPALGLLEQAATIGQLVYVEQLLFHELGKARAGLEAPPRLWATAASFRAAWRAEQLSVLLPVSAGLPTASDLVSSAPEDLAELLGEVVSTADMGEELAAATGSIYERLLSVYRGHLKNSVHPADEPFAIVLRRVIADLEDAGTGLRRSPEGPGRTT